MSWKLAPKLPQMNTKLTRIVFRKIFRLSGWSVKGEVPNEAKMVVAFAPHNTNWDFPIAISLVFGLGLKIRFLAKHTLFTPLTGWAFRGLGGIPVNRTSSHGLVGDITDTFNKSDKMILVVTPEGTRSQVSQWKKGFLHIAKAADVPVLLVTINYRKKVISIGKTYAVQDIDKSLSVIQQDAYSCAS